MIKVEDIKSCGGVSTVVIVEEGGSTPGESSAIEMRSNGTHIQYRPAGGDVWTNIIALSALVGPAGTPGTPGTPGAAGLSIELQKTSTHVQWRVVGGSWADLIALSEITGPTGPAGSGSSASNPRVIYVRTDGDNATAQIGNPAKPFATALHAYDAGVATGQGFLLNLGVGDFSLSKPGEELSANFCGARGCGYNVETPSNSLTRLVITTKPNLTSNGNGGNAGTNGGYFYALYLVWSNGGGDVTTNDEIGGYTGGNGGALTVRGDALWELTANGGSAFNNANGEHGFAGSGGNISIYGGVLKEAYNSEGAGFSAGVEVPPGTSGQILCEDCDLRTANFTAPYDISAGRCALPSGLTVTEKGGNSAW